MIEQPRLIGPPERPLAAARDAVRRARERALTAVPTPSPPSWSPFVSQAASTLDEVPRGRPAAPDPPPHGTRARYNHRENPCRCTRCRVANTRYIAAYRARPRHDEDQGAEVLAR
ncbi:MAG TPA: hypothetical protein VFU25_04135 [Ornithinibacter sp.]|nr:hypothetical protein [Ornithinibacter sp.]